MRHLFSTFFKHAPADRSSSRGNGPSTEYFPKKRSKILPLHRAAVDALETRRLLSASLSGTTLTVTGTAGNDVATFTPSGTNLLVSDNGTNYTYALSAVSVIVFNGNTGNDSAVLADNLSVRASLYGNDGNDTLAGGLLNDYLIGGAGDDSLAGGDGNDTLGGSDGNDTLQGGLGADVVDGGNGIDLYNASGSTDDLYVWINGLADDGASGEGDYVQGTIENVRGGAGDDTIIGSSAANYIEGLDGNDLLAGVGGNDTLVGGLGDDTLQGGSGNDSLEGDDGSDTADYSDHTASVNVSLDGVANDGDTLLGEADGIGADVENIVGGTAADVLAGNASANVITGNYGNDTITGGPGNDTLDGQGSNDLLTGGVGNDSIGGGDGNDVITGEAGADTLTGGNGNDVFNAGDNDSVIDLISGGVGTDAGSVDGQDNTSDGTTESTTFTGDLQAPQNVQSAVNTAGGNIYTITWSISDPRVAGFEVESQLVDVGENYHVVGTAGSTVLSFQTTALPYDRTTKFRVRSLAPGRAAYSSEISITPTVSNTSIGAPTGFTAYATEQYGYLAWDAPNVISVYKRELPEVPWHGGGYFHDYSYVDNFYAPGTELRARVETSVNGQPAVSPWSAGVVPVVGPSAVVSPPPSNITATAHADGTATVTWSATTSGFDYYWAIVWSADKKEYGIAGSYEPGTERNLTMNYDGPGSATVHDLTPGKTYCFAVCQRPGGYVPSAWTKSSPVVGAGNSTPDPVAAPAYFNATLVGHQNRAADKVGLIWQNTSNNEEKWQLQQRETGTSTWTDLPDTGSDGPQQTLVLNDPSKSYDLRIRSIKGNAYSDWVNTTVKGVVLKAINFGGNGRQVIKRDDGSGNFSSPDWNDGNLDGNISGPPGGTPFLDGTIDGTTDWKFPISYSRAGAAGQTTTSRIAMDGTLTNGSIYLPQAMVKASSAQYSFPATPVVDTSSGIVLDSILTANVPVVSTIDYRHLEISWEMSLDGGASWFNLATTDNPIYVTGVAASGAFHSVLYSTCKNAQGLDPSTNESGVINAIWGDFTDRSVSRVKGGLTLQYYGSWITSYYTAADLLKYGDGNCFSWSQLFKQCIDAHVASGATEIQVLPNNSSGFGGFLINNWTFPTNGGSLNGTSQIVSAQSELAISSNSYAWLYSDMVDVDGVAGQGNSNPASIFIKHGLVQVNGKYYDPSYGSGPFTDILSWESASVTAFYVRATENRSEISLNTDLNGDGDILDTDVACVVYRITPNPSGIQVYGIAYER